MKILHDFLTEHHFKLDQLPLNLNQYNKDGETPLMVAIKSFNLLVLIAILRHNENHFDINLVRKSDRATAFIIAAQLNFVEAAQELLETVDLDVNRKDAFEKTALDYAAEFGHKFIVTEILLNTKHKISLASLSCGKVCQMALAHGHREIALIILQEMIEKAPIHEAEETQQVSLLWQKLHNGKEKNRPSLGSVPQEDVRADGVMLVQELTTFLRYDAKMAFKNVDEIWFENFIAKFQSWTNMLKERTLDKLNENFKKNQYNLINIKQPIFEENIIKKLKRFWHECTRDYKKRKMALFNPHLLYESEIDEDIEVTVNNIISNLSLLQAIFGIYLSMKRDHDLSVELGGCENFFIEAQHSFETKLYNNIKNMRKLKAKEHFYTVLLKEASENNSYSGLIENIKIDRDETANLVEEHQAYMRYYIIIIRLGLFPRQINEILKDLKLMNRQYKNNITAPHFEELTISVVVDNLEELDCFDKDLLDVIFETAVPKANKCVLDSMSFAEHELQEQLELFKQSAFLCNQLCEDKSVQCSSVLWIDGWLDYKPLAYSLYAFFPAFPCINILYYNVLIRLKEMNESVSYQNDKLEDINHELNKLIDDMEKLKQEISNKKDKQEPYRKVKAALVQEKSNLVSDILLETMFSEKFTFNSDNDFLPLYQLNDEGLFVCENGFQNIAFEISLKEEFGSISELEALKKTARLVYDILKKREKFHARIQEKIETLEKRFFDNENELDSIQGEIDDLAIDIKEHEKEIQRLEGEKDIILKRIKSISQECFSLLYIKEKITTQAMLLGHGENLEQVNIKEMSENTIQKEKNRLFNIVSEMIEKINIAFIETYSPNSQEMLTKMIGIKTILGVMSTETLQPLMRFYCQSDYTREIITSQMSVIYDLVENLEQPFKNIASIKLQM